MDKPAGVVTVATLRQSFHLAQRVLVVSHIRPDGDALGSMLGLGLALQQAGKNVQMVSPDGVIAALRHLPGSELIRTHPDGDFDLVAVVDCSDLSRVGEALKDLGRSPDVNIDHHITNENFARLNLVWPESAATAEILADIIPSLGLSLTPEVAAALLTGMITDTLGFRTSNVTPKTLRISAKLMDAGADLPELYRQALIQRSFQAAHFWGLGLSQLQHEDRLVWTTLTLADRQAAEYPGRDDADLINIVAAINGADVALIFVEQPHGRVKVSWRCQPGLDVSQVAVQFGGGGHKAASGAEIAGSLEEVRAKVLEATRPLVRAV